MATLLTSFSTFFNLSLPSWPFTVVSWQPFDLSPVNHHLPTAVLPFCTEELPDPGVKTVGRLPLRTRWSNQCVILEWQVSIAFKPSFVLYRGVNLEWETAKIVDISIFSVRDSETEQIYYNAVDRKVISQEPIYYWVVMYISQNCEQRFGPFTVALDRETHYA